MQSGIRNLRRIVLFAICILLLPAAAAAQAVARITDVTGAVSFRHGEQWQPAGKTPIDLFDGDKVNTEKGRASVFFLGDESTVVLDVGTNITIHQPASFGSAGFVRRVEIYVGDLWFKMTKGATQHTELATPTAVGGLRGTEGLVHVENDEDSSFTLNEGKLEISPVSGPGGKNIAPLLLQGGQMLHAVSGQTFAARPATTMPSRPDVHVAPDKLPEPKPGRTLRPSEKPSAEATVAAERAATEAPKGESESGKAKSKPAKPAKTPKPPRRKP